MVMNRSIATVLAMVLSAAPAWAQVQIPQQTPPGLSPARAAVPPSFAMAAARFWEIGNEIAHTENITGPEADQAIILLTAAKSLNRQLVGAEPLLLKLAGHQASEDYSNELVVFWLQEYVSSSADRAIVADAIRGVLSRVNSPDQRKALLEKLALKIKNKNPAIDSDVATLLGQLVLEQGDTEQAKWYLVQAYNNNRYNRTAFAELGKVAPDEIGPAANLEHLRLLVRENPLDLDAAMAFAGYAGQLQIYDVSAQAYSYCAELFRYLYPSEPLPQKIYLPLALSCYNVNTQEAQKLCLTIADIIRAENRFDIILEAFAGRASIKLGQPLKAARCSNGRSERRRS